MTVPAAEVQRNFGRYQDQAVIRPVRVTSHGRARVMMISVEEYERLKRRDRVALRVEELSEDVIKAIRRARPPAQAKRYDREVR